MCIRDSPYTVQQQGERKGQFHVKQQLPAGHAHAPGGLDDAAVDLTHADVGVGEQRRYGEQHEGDHRGAVAPPPDRGQQEQDQHGEGGHGPADVGDVHGERAALAEVAEDERDGQRDQTAEDQAHDGEQEVLEQPVPDAVVARPVRGVGEPVPGGGEGAHVRAARVQGVISRWTPSRSRSAATAISTQSTDAVSTWALK